MTNGSYIAHFYLAATLHSKHKTPTYSGTVFTNGKEKFISSLKHGSFFFFPTSDSVQKKKVEEKGSEEIWPTKSYLLFPYRLSLLKCYRWGSCCGSVVTNPSSVHEDSGSIPSLVQWVTERAVGRCHELWYRL